MDSRMKRPGTHAVIRHHAPTSRTRDDAANLTLDDFPAVGLDLPVSVNPESDHGIQLARLAQERGEGVGTAPNVASPAVANGGNPLRPMYYPTDEAEKMVPGLTKVLDPPPPVLRRVLSPDPVMKLKKVLGYSPVSSNSVVWLNADNSVAYPCHKLVVVLNTETREQRFLTGHTEAVVAIAVNSTGDFLASAQRGAHPLLRIWDPIRGVVLCTIGHRFSIQTLSLSAQGRVLSVTGKDGHGRQRVTLYDCTGVLQRGKAQMITQTQTDALIDVFKISPFDANKIVSCGRGNIRLWRVKKGAARSCPVNLSAFRHTTPEFTDVGFRLQDGVDIIAYVASKSGDVFEVNCTSVRLLAVHHLHDSPINSIHVSNAFCVTGADDRLLRAWPLTFAEPFLEAEHDSGTIASVDVTADDATITVGTTSGNIGLLEVEARSYTTVMRSHSRAVNAVVFDPSRNEFATASEDGSIRLWNSDTATQLFEFRVSDDTARSIAFRPAAHDLAAGFETGFVRVFNVESTQISCALKQHTGAVTNVAYSKDGERLYSAGEDGVLVLYDVLQGYLPLKVISFANPGRAIISINPAGTCLAYNGPSKRSLTVTDAVTLEETAQFSIGVRNSSKSEIACMTYSSDGAEIFVCSTTGEALVLNAKDGTLLREVPAAHAGGPVAACVVGGLAPSSAAVRSMYFGTSGHDGAIKIWDAALLADPTHQVFVGHAEAPKCLAFTDDGKHFVSAGEAILFWEFSGAWNGGTATDIVQPGLPRSARMAERASRQRRGGGGGGGGGGGDGAAVEDGLLPSTLLTLAGVPNKMAVGKLVGTGHDVGKAELNDAEEQAAIQVIRDRIQHSGEELAMPLADRVQEPRWNAPFGDTAAAHELAVQFAVDEAAAKAGISLTRADGSSTGDGGGGGAGPAVTAPHVRFSSGSGAGNGSSTTDGGRNGSGGAAAAAGEGGHNTSIDYESTMEKPEAIAHYVSSTRKSTLASKRYVASPDQAGLEIDVVLGYAIRGRRNVHWHPLTGTFVYSLGPAVVLDDLDSRVQQHLVKHVEEVSTIAMQHDGKQIASCCGPSTTTDGMAQICIWNLAAKECTQSLLYHVGDVGALAFSKDDSLLVSVGNYKDCAVAVWAVSSGELLAASQCDWPVHAVAWDPVSPAEFATVGENAELSFWLLTGDEERPVLNVHAAPVPEALYGCAFTSLSYDGNNGLYVGDSTGTVSMWDTRENVCVESWPVETGEVCSVVVSDGKMVTAGASQAVKLWSLHGDEQDGLLLEAEVPLDGTVTTTAMDSTLAMGIAATTSGTIWYINLGDQRRIRLVNSHTDQITDLAFSLDEKYLTSTSMDGTVRIWSVDGKEQVMQFQLADAGTEKAVCHCVAISPDAASCVAGFGDGAIRSFDLGRVDLDARYSPHDCAVVKIEYSIDGEVVISGNEKGVIVVSSASAGSTLRVLADHKGAGITDFDLCRSAPEPGAEESGNLWLAASQDRRISVWRSDWSKDKCELVDWLTFAAPAFVPGKDAATEPPTLAKFSPANADIIVVATFGMEPQILFHSISSRRILRKTRLSAWAKSLDIIPGSDLYAVGFDSRLVRLIDYEQGSYQDFVGHSASCSVVRFSYNGTYLASAGCEGIIIWKVRA